MPSIIPFSVVGMFSIDASAIATSPVVRGGTMVDNGTGDTTITLSDGGIDATECLVLTGVRGATEGVINIDHTSDVDKEVIVKDDAGVAADIDADVLILRVIGV